MGGPKPAPILYEHKTNREIKNEKKYPPDAVYRDETQKRSSNGRIMTNISIFDQNVN